MTTSSKEVSLVEVTSAQPWRSASIHPIFALSQALVGKEVIFSQPVVQNTPPLSHVHDNGKTPAGERETLQARAQPIEKRQDQLFCFSYTGSRLSGIYKYMHIYL